MDDERDERTFSERFEGLLSGVPRFVWAFVATPGRLLFGQVSPDRLNGATPPFTFLFLCCFLASRTLSTYVNPHRDWMELFARIHFATDVVDLLRVALPMALTVLAASAVLEKVSNSHGGDRFQRTAFLSYAPACALLAVFIASLLMAWADYSLRGDFPSMEERVEVSNYTVAGMVALSLLSLLIAYNVAFTVLRTWWRAFLLAVTLLAGAYGSFVVGAKFEALPKLATGPRRTVVAVTLVETLCEWNEDGIEATFKLLLENPHPEPMTVIDRGDVLPPKFAPDTGLILNAPQLVWGRIRTRLAIADSPNGNAPFFVIPAWGRSWVTLEVRLDPENAQDLLRYATTSGDVRIGIPFVRGDVADRAGNRMDTRIPLWKIEECMGAD